MSTIIAGMDVGCIETEKSNGEEYSWLKQICEDKNLKYSEGCDVLMSLSRSQCLTDVITLHCSCYCVV